MERRRELAVIVTAILTLAITALVVVNYETLKTRRELLKLIQSESEYSELTVERSGFTELTISGKFKSKNGLVRFMKEGDKIRNSRVFVKPDVHLPAMAYELYMQKDK